MADTWAQASVMETSVLDIDASGWSNCHVRKVKRAEGPILLSVSRVVGVVSKTLAENPLEDIGF
jgi:hypothetical protein